MNFYSQNLYQELEDALDNSFQGKYNLKIITLPGMGVSYFAKRYLEKNKEKRINYIHDLNQKVSDYNILDLNISKIPQNLSVADVYFKSANIRQKFAFILDTPSIQKKVEYNRTYLSTHFYRSYFFRSRDLADTTTFSKEINIHLTDDKTQKIFKLSGGIGSLIKYLSINTEKIDLDMDHLLTDKVVLEILQPMVTEMEKCDMSTLNSLGIIENDSYRSLIIRKWFELHPIRNDVDVVVNGDLVFLENNIPSEEKFNKIEKSIIEHMLANEGVITKEIVAEFKWGKDSYDTYSDQAVGKTIQRLRKKLKFYDIEVIPRLGYKIVNRK